MQLTLSKHAIVRAQQRGIPIHVVDWLLLYGSHEHDKRGCVFHYFDRRGRDRLTHDLHGVHMAELSKHLNSYAVLSRDGTVVTIGHRTHRVNRKGGGR